ncbi:MAG TPA: DUF1634 domain-containing protein [Gemmatimonadales bacterium]|nr:DUF1634 domain-containing protein [Gemmatimonadales bacterium]
MRTEIGSAEAPIRAPAGHGMRPVVSALLRYGVILSAATIILGLVLLLFQVGLQAFISIPRVPAAESTDLTSVRAVLSQLLPPVPQAVMDAGILLLIATPVLTVGASVVSFAIEGDRLYALIAAVVFAMLIIGFTVGRGTTGAG